MTPLGYCTLWALDFQYLWRRSESSGELVVQYDNLNMSYSLFYLQPFYTRYRTCGRRSWGMFGLHPYRRLGMEETCFFFKWHLFLVSKGSYVEPLSPFPIFWLPNHYRKALGCHIYLKAPHYIWMLYGALKLWDTLFPYLTNMTQNTMRPMLLVGLILQYS